MGRGVVAWCGVVWCVCVRMLVCVVLCGVLVWLGGLVGWSAFVAHEARRGVCDSGFVVENGPPALALAPNWLPADP